jgi:CRISPR-associated protein Cas5t
MPLPPYSSIFGMMSACAGRDIRPDGKLKIGFEFVSDSRDTIDLEKTDRLKTDPKGRLRHNPEQGIVKRQFHFNPRLDLYITDINLKVIFDSPVTPPRFGRSQDLAWIANVKEINLEPVDHGQVHAALVPYNGEPLGQVLPPLVDYYINDEERFTRTPARMSRYIALPVLDRVIGFPLSSTHQTPLFHPGDSLNTDHAVILLDFQT